jgi:DNA-directed RNA polymerase subunit M/transcription elongation factor TFIIS
MTKPNEGFIPEKKIMNERVLGECTKCSFGELIWTERILISGSLEMYHIVSSEMLDVFQCEKCKHTWSENKYT